MSRRRSRLRGWERGGGDLETSMMKPSSLGVEGGIPLGLEPSAQTAKRSEWCEVCGKAATLVVVSINPKTRIISNKSFSCNECDSKIVDYLRSYRKGDLLRVITAENLGTFTIEDIMRKGSKR